MTASEPWLDQRTLHRRTPDWCVAVRQGDGIRLHRFASPEDARAFADEFAASPDEPTPEEAA